MVNLIMHLAQIDSTNSYALRELANLPDQQIITAECQTLGRGRLDRKWVSDNTHNLYLSIVLKPENKSIFPWLSQLTAVALAKTINSYLPLAQAKIKFPNDILVDNKKIAGILVETKKIGAVVGIGVNLGMTATECAQLDQPVTSLNLLLNQTVAKNEFLKKLLADFFEQYQQKLLA